MSTLYNSIVHNFFIAFGVVFGASVFAGIGAIITNNPPLKVMIDLSSSIKIWAMAIALGDTFSSYAIIEKGLFEGEFKTIIKQAIYVLTALLGANTGYSFIKLIHRCGDIWGK
ncbi:MAG: sporulation protein [Firmicutes bacterium HGW-Firmicutes-7]|nr:MAG: sporulation protein [Firmicutes bacterium HGW-Firmicutes-7]